MWYGPDQQVEMLCSRCGLHVATGSKFCRDCGMPLSWQCASCEHQNAAGARFCSVCGQTSAKEFPEDREAADAVKASAKPQVERRRLTVMFVDLVGSTALGTRLDPEDLREAISAHHNCVTNLVTENGGYVARYIGDGILAYFGYPSAHEDDAECAVRSGLLAVEAVHRLSSPAGPPGSLSCRVGIATGIAVIGAIVDGDRDSQTAVGETPNFAARLQAIAETGAVVIDEATRRLTGEIFQYRRLGPLALKGLAGPVTAWAVTKENIIESRFKALRSIETPLVGRIEEKSLLLRRWEQVLAGQGVMCLLIGEAGVGKSRLISVLEDASQEGDRLPPLQFSCSAHQQDAPLYPIIRHIELAAKIESGDSMSVRSQKLALLLAEYGATEIDGFLIGDLLSISMPAPSLPLDLSARRKRDMTLASIIRLLRMQTAQSARLAVFEDLHWADQVTLDLIDRLVDEIDQFPLMVIASGRLEFRPPWITRPQVSHLMLTGLDRRHAALLVGAVAGEHALSAEIIDEIVSRSDGVPLHIEELTKSVLEIQLDQLKVGVGRSLVPPSLHASLTARLDRHPDAKEVAQTASVIGREFSFDVLRSISDLDESVLIAALNELTAAGLVNGRGYAPESAYSFKHALVQNAAYDSILRNRRRHLHLRLALLLEGAAEHSPITNAEVLALHFEEAGEPERSIKYYLLAAEKASGRSALAEKASHLKNALRQQELLPSQAQSAERELMLQLQLGRALIDLRGSGSAEVLTCYERARALGLRTGDAVSLLRVYDGLINYYFTHSDAESLSRCAADIRNLHQDTNLAGSRSEVMSLRAAGLAHFIRGQFGETCDVLSRLLTDYEVDRDGPEANLASRDMKASMYTIIGMSQTAMGYPESGCDTAMKGVRHAESLNHVITLVLAMRRACVQRIMWRDVEGCAALSARLLEVNRDHETFLGKREGGFFHSWALSRTQASVSHLEAMRRHIAELDEAGHSVILPFFMAVAAEVHHEQGQHAEAFTLLERAFQLVELTGETWCKSEIMRMRALVCAAGATERDLWLAEAVAIARGQGARLWELRAAAAQAACWHAEGKVDAAYKVLLPALSGMTEGQSTLEFNTASKLLARIKAAVGASCLSGNDAED
ncbi:adenylate/guanylate cyclase domain-containing protein [Bradyrhizobium sp. BR 10261]|uniref:adenylate/guanylate cyclase domain-containing protein n=1 Tax=Bradyrhizobium sp. BR 10261 TaxID=2749992 RepID=UPI001C64BE1D|nr:adenylate/guanylate cyclase domain-containing protein [Bradyrhizobium sp. BR 10261]MBW7966347.1 AAA family ATPase [Bradyrhizobium sp. BR 10261]